MSGGVRRARQSLQGLGECARDAHPHDIHLGACAHIPQYPAPDPKPTNLGRPLGLEGQELRWGRRRGTHALLDTLLRRSGRSHLLHRERLLQPISIRFAPIEPNSTRMLQDNTHKPRSSPRSCFAISETVFLFFDLSTFLLLNQRRPVPCPAHGRRRWAPGKAFCRSFPCAQCAARPSVHRAFAWAAFASLSRPRTEANGLRYRLPGMRLFDRARLVNGQA